MASHFDQTAFIRRRSFKPFREAIEHAMAAEGYEPASRGRELFDMAQPPSVAKSAWLPDKIALLWIPPKKDGDGRLRQWCGIKSHPRDFLCRQGNRSLVVRLANLSCLLGAPSIYMSCHDLWPFRIECDAEGNLVMFSRPTPEDDLRLTLPDFGAALSAPKNEALDTVNLGDGFAPFILTPSLNQIFEGNYWTGGFEDYEDFGEALLGRKYDEWYNRILDNVLESGLDQAPAGSKLMVFQKTQH